MAEVRFKDFTLDAPEIKFAIAGENFDASPALSAVLLQQIEKTSEHSTILKDMLTKPIK